jgi:hypothetical protein
MRHATAHAPPRVAHVSWPVADAHLRATLNSQSAWAARRRGRITCATCKVREGEWLGQEWQAEGLDSEQVDACARVSTLYTDPA